ncbi:hypothetical protein GCM10023215_54110 [Pseudonocardia yuanmonensis]|uniref:Uncharacterized protein n=1 Tax=Pseudonocardia yuanmonensis TaxID=1095914 RepID=A0ABP8XFR5_9PSEU
MVAPSGVRRTSWVRPPSVGRASAQITASPSVRAPDNRTEASTTSSDVIGVGQEPKGSTAAGSSRPGVEGAVCAEVTPQR